MAFTNIGIVLLCALAPASGIHVSGKTNTTANATKQPPDDAIMQPLGAQHNRTVAQLTSSGSWPVPQGTRPKFATMAAEFVATSLYIFVGCGTYMGLNKAEGSAWQLQLALTFAMAYASLSWAIGHYGGGQMNPALTVAMVFVGRITIAQGILNFIFQVFGCIAGSILLLLIYPADKDQTGNLGLNQIQEGWTKYRVLFYEAVMSFVLSFVVLETMTNPMALGNSMMAPAAVGGIVFLSHALLIPVDGCSINPARSLGPALAVKYLSSLKTVTRGHINTERFDEKEAPFEDHWVFWAGPITGALVAAGISAAFQP